jgi:hypothetical protein
LLVPQALPKALACLVRSELLLAQLAKVLL